MFKIVWFCLSLHTRLKPFIGDSSVPCDFEDVPSDARLVLRVLAGSSGLECCQAVVDWRIMR